MDQVVAAILAGGESRRMGRAKAAVELAGRPLISFPLAAARAAELAPIVLAKPGSELPPLDCPVVRDEDERSHPLSGILAALRAADGKPVLVIGCDMPFVAPGLIAWLASLPEPLVVPTAGGRLQPLLARLTPDIAESLSAALDAERPTHEAFSSLRPRLVGEDDLARFGDPERLLFNVNRPADLQSAEAILASGSTSTSAL